MSGGGGGGGDAEKTKPEEVWKAPAKQAFNPVIDPLVLQQLAASFPPGFLNSLGAPLSYAPRGLLPPVKK